MPNEWYTLIHANFIKWKESATAPSSGRQAFSVASLVGTGLGWENSCVGKYMLVIIVHVI